MKEGRFREVIDEERGKERKRPWLEVAMIDFSI